MSNIVRIINGDFEAFCLGQFRSSFQNKKNYSVEKVKIGIL